MLKFVTFLLLFPSPHFPNDLPSVSLQSPYHLPIAYLLKKLNKSLCQLSIVNYQLSIASPLAHFV